MENPIGDGMQEFNQNNSEKEKTGKVKSITFFSFSDEDALSTLRFYAPTSLYDVNRVKGVENGIIFEERAREGDLIVLQRDFPLKYDSYEKILEISKREHIPVILDIDDLLFELPENHPDRLENIFTFSLLPLLKAVMEVDLITVTTKKLKEYLINFNENIVVLPNLIDERIWELRPSKSLKKKIRQ